jgi:WD40 repeat protein
MLKIQQSEQVRVARTIEVGLDFLDETSKVTAARTRFSELAVFPEDADVPIEIVVRLWKQTGGLDKLDTEDLLSHLSHLSLLLSLDLDHHTFRFHDTVRQFLRERAGSNAISVLNKTLNRAMNDLGSTDINGTSRRYYYLYLARHLAEAGDRAALNALLTNPAWLNGKFHALNSIHELIGDYEKFGKGHFQILLKRTLRLISGTVERDKRQLLSQLLVRLAPNVHPEAALFLAAARKLIHAPAFVPESATLPPAGAERIRLDGHTHGVTSLVSFKDGRLASSGEDTTIRIWDLDNAKELQRLEGHTEQINSLIVLPTGRLASAAGSDTRPYSDYAIRIWDVETGMLVARLEGHTKPVNAFAVLPDGHLASASACTLHLWDIETREQVACLEGHAGLITTLALLADSHLASGSDDGSIRIWDLRKPNAITSTQLEHGEGVKALVVLPNGILISVADHGLKLWNVADGILVDELKDIRPVDLIDYAFTALPDGRIVWGAGYTIIVQEAKRKANRAYLRGNISKVSALAVLPDGRLASGARDGTVRIWNPDESSQNYFNKTGHLSEVMALVALSGNRLASASRDSTVRLWDVGRKAEVLQLSGESCDGFRALTKITDGRIATGSQDGTIRVWTVRSGHGLTYGFEKLRFNNGFDKAYSVDEQRRGVSALATLPDGRLASGSVDSIIRIWDLKRTRKSERNKGEWPFKRTYSTCSGPYGVAGGSARFRIMGRDGPIMEYRN